jgi:hypothetical protein
MNITANLWTWSDADFAGAFRLRTGQSPDTFYNFRGCELNMMIRKFATDIEVFISLTSAPTGEGEGGIMYNDPEGGDDGPIEVFNILIARDQFTHMPPGDYVQSLIMLRPDGVYEDIWHGTLTHQTGPTHDD